jgi:hypothetical protein
MTSDFSCSVRLSIVQQVGDSNIDSGKAIQSRKCNNCIAVAGMLLANAKAYNFSRDFNITAPISTKFNGGYKLPLTNHQPTKNPESALAHSKKVGSLTLW